VMEKTQYVYKMRLPNMHLSEALPGLARKSTICVIAYNLRDCLVEHYVCIKAHSRTIGTERPTNWSPETGSIGIMQ